MRKQYASSVSFVVILCIGFLGGILLAPVVSSQQGFSLPLQPAIKATGSISDLVAKTSPSVVSITSVAGNPRTYGTGFIISSQGIIITCAHVVKDGKTSYEITTANNKTYPVKIVGLHEKEDIAFLKVDAGNLPTLPLGDSNGVKPGEQILAIGNPFGVLDGTVTTGIVSGVHRDIIAVEQDSTYKEGLDDVIQIDASLNPGESGGPLLNMSGQVVGMNAASDTRAQNISFAIPINAIKRLSFVDGLSLL
jgi:S1-C subfamily serine protease